MPTLDGHRPVGPVGGLRVPLRAKVSSSVEDDWFVYGLAAKFAVAPAPHLEVIPYAPGAIIHSKCSVILGSKKEKIE